MNMNKGIIRNSREDRIFNSVVMVFLCAFVLAIMYPIIYIVSCSFSSAQAVMGGRVFLWPVDFSLDGYKTIFNYKAVWTGYLNSIYYAVIGTAINVFLTILCAYPLSRKDLFGRGLFTFLITFTMLFSGGMIPTYLLVSNLGLINTRWSMIFPTAISVWNVIITRTYYQNTIPGEMLEAARIDGCDDFLFLLKVVLPLSSAITAVNVLFYAVGHWNSYFDAMLYLHDESMYPLQIVLRKILVLNSIDSKMMNRAAAYATKVGIKELLKYSLIIVASLPMMILYPFLQKYFVKGVMIGSLKG